MPKKMRRAALFSCLSSKAKAGAIIGLESYPEDAKTKNFFALLKKLPLDIGRKIVIVTPAAHTKLELAARNVPGVKTLYAQYLNPEDVLGANKIVFMSDAVAVAEKTFASDVNRVSKKLDEKKEVAAKEPKVAKEPKAKKATKPKAEAKKPASKKKAA
jgi:ribosomal protein L4